jgi:hypothetical protein
MFGKVPQVWGRGEGHDRQSEKGSPLHLNFLHQIGVSGGMSDDLRSPRPFGSDEALLLVASAMSGGSARAIDERIVADQIERVVSDTLPTKGLSDLAAFGIEVLRPVPNDSLLSFVKMGDWKKRRTDHPMWTEVLDPQGRVRALSFSGPFYDRDEFLDVFPRYTVQTDSDHFKATGDMVAFVKDAATGAEVFRTDPCRGGEAYDLRQVAQQRARVWLDTNFPEWKTCTAYWDVP